MIADAERTVVVGQSDPNRGRIDRLRFGKPNSNDTEPYSVTSPEDAEATRAELVELRRRMTCKSALRSVLGKYSPHLTLPRATRLDCVRPSLRTSLSADGPDDFPAAGFLLRRPFHNGYCHYLRIGKSKCGYPFIFASTNKAKK
jgi:hypothetical protein